MTPFDHGDRVRDRRAGIVDRTGTVTDTEPQVSDLRGDSRIGVVWDGDIEEDRVPSAYLESVTTVPHALEGTPCGATKTRKPASKYAAILASNCIGAAFPPLDPPWVTCIEVEPHGAVCITRFTSDERCEQFELSLSEVDALIAIRKKRKALMKRYHAERNAPTPDGLCELDDIPF